ncbi:MAG: cytochrome c, partial [Mesorhizobium sp.]
MVAAAGPDPIVATRQSSMKEMAAAAKTIAGMFDGKLAYDAA